MGAVARWKITVRFCEVRCFYMGAALACVKRPLKHIALVGILKPRRIVRGQPHRKLALAGKSLIVKTDKVTLVYPVTEREVNSVRLKGGVPVYKITHFKIVVALLARKCSLKCKFVCAAPNFVLTANRPEASAHQMEFVAHAFGKAQFVVQMHTATNCTAAVKHAAAPALHANLVKTVHGNRRKIALTVKRRIHGNAIPKHGRLLRRSSSERDRRHTSRAVMPDLYRKRKFEQSSQRCIVSADFLPV